VSVLKLSLRELFLEINYVSCCVCIIIYVLLLLYCYVSSTVYLSFLICRLCMYYRLCVITGVLLSLAITMEVYDVDETLWLLSVKP